MIYALDVVKHAIDFVIYALRLVKHGLTPSSNPWTGIAVYGLNDASLPKNVSFRGVEDNPQF